MDSTTKIILSMVSSLIVAVSAFIIITTGFAEKWMNPFIISITAYIVSLIVSSIFQFTACKTVNITSISISNTFVIATTFATSLILYFEDFPFLKHIFGEYDPRNPYDGIAYEKGSAPWMVGMDNENHYKIQFFSSIVKAVVPMYVDDTIKTGLVYLYWIFWMTILPVFFLLGFQGICNA
jgi:hypothetical protein